MLDAGWLKGVGSSEIKGKSFKLQTSNSRRTSSPESQGAAWLFFDVWDEVLLKFEG
jgi:hypothetical protein